ncbi:xanthine dehydrogenase family protein molybdopterin-binding subunit [Euzebya tangerina]|uniref:xanthine dehydrogenase family protein molybdopterin-binding subunit n=1 Tax=Euzebya tangerina TaxID=591198 RepID=UPI000E31F556|nr:molybdopterin cofactor-binding domain-containing protein [Euzebya tangerina]
MSLVGAAVLRKEDPNLLVGRGTFTDDLHPAGTAFMAFVRSPEAHARITGIDTSAAADMPGVHGVWSLAELSLGEGEGIPPLPGVPGLERPALADGVVRFAGEPVAVLVADDRYLAADAVEAVDVDYEPLPAVASIPAALAEDAPLLYEPVGSNVVFGIPWEDDAEAELAAAQNRTSIRLVNQRCAPVPLEPMVILADASAEGLTVHVTFQAPHHLRTKLAGWLGEKEHRIRVIAPDVGGGFGSKINFTPELFLAPLLSRQLGRPVKHCQTRSEAMQLMYHGRDQIHDVEVGFDDDGRVRALRNMISQNVGGYPDPNGMGMAVLTTWMSAGCYKIDKVAAGFQNVVTNTTPIAAYRGAGRPEATYMIERVMDLVADETGLDPADVRRRNFIGPDEFPFSQPHAEAVHYDTGNYEAALDKLLEMLDYDTLKQEQAARRDDPDRPLMGIGMSTWVEIASFGPRGSLEGFGHLGSWESAKVRLQPDGSVVVNVGSAPHGQGHETAFAMIAADELGVDYDNIIVRAGDTETMPQGIGTMGSRSVPIAGSAVKAASEKILVKAKEIAAHLIEANPDDLELRDGGFGVIGSPEDHVNWQAVAHASFQPGQLPEGVAAGGLDEQVFQEVPNFTYPSGAYGCVVGIDRDTGEVRVERYVLVDDCGTVINPLLAKGQVHGGAAQGIAQALYEAVVYDDAGQPQTSSLLDYLAPAATELPAFEEGRVSTPTPVNPLGAKGIGESGAIGSPPAVVNAVVDALSHLGVRHLDMPLSPEKVWNAMNDNGATS